MPNKILTDKLLSSSAYSHIIKLPIDRIDIADWLFNLPEEEYKRCCPPDHISCGTTSTDDGTRMSINVEMIGQTLMIQPKPRRRGFAAWCRPLTPLRRTAEPVYR